MARRAKTTSLKRRFAWTLSSAAMIGLVSLVSIVSYRSTQKSSVNQEPGRLVADAAQPIPEIDNTPASERSDVNSRVVQAIAFEGSSDPHGSSDARRVVRPVSGEQFVEQTPGIVPAGNFHSPRYGYSVSLAGTAWTRWDDLTSVVPGAEWGALLKNYGRFLVIPVVLTDAATSDEAVDRALLTQFGFEYPIQQSSEMQTLERWGAQIHVFRLNREISGRDNIYRIWTVRRDRNAYLVAGWIDRTAAMKAKIGAQKRGASQGPSTIVSQLDGEIAAQLDDVLGRFRLDNPSNGAVSSATNPRQPLRRLVRWVVLETRDQR
jgi:hypothetical protein